ncbi:hypothetical protein HN499_04800 [archaeon]|jgi:hypothetical protein|nr:hypothetical protein [archaeon]MBT3578097.1 hypothetical protein [archaeon]MBT6956486.1 hypothetical protein [archaeon]MBT7024945.1 hypothetical protein [archaeon]MBT7238564.1 hypothetical protein [archaeon]
MVTDIPQELSRVYLAENQGNTWNTSENSVNSVGNMKVDSMKEAVSEVEELITERGVLSLEFIKEGESMKTQINNFLLENAPKGEDDSEFTRERAELRKKQMDISELQLNERVGCWRDIALLKRELRERQKELSDKEGRAEILDKILTDEDGMKGGIN